MSALKVYMHIRIEECLIEGAKAYLSSKGSDLNGSRVQMHI